MTVPSLSESTGSFPLFTCAFSFTLLLLSPESPGKTTFPAICQGRTSPDLSVTLLSPISSALCVWLNPDLRFTVSLLVQSQYWAVWGSANSYSFPALKDVSYSDTKAFELEIMEFGIFVVL